MKKLVCFLLGTAMLLSSVSCTKKADTQGKYMLENENVRLENVFKKIRNHEDVSVVLMGGSITTGFAATPINENSWGALTGKWFKDLAAANKCNLKFSNKGCSGTDSAFGVVRVKDHVLSEKPDLVILEYAMNDQWLEAKTRQRTYEGIIRQIMNNSDTAILALFVNERKSPYSSNQAEEQKICEYYHIPYVSWKDSLFADNPGTDFEAYFAGAETVHPDNAGHASIASYIIKKLQSVWDNLPANNKIPSPVKKLPEPLTDSAFENVTYYTSDNLTPVSNDGWEAGSPVHDEWKKLGNAHQGWQTNEFGSEVVFEVEGSTIGLTYAESDQFNNVVAWIEDEDGNEDGFTFLDCYVSYRNGYYGWAYREVYHGEVSKKFKLHLMLNTSNIDGGYGNITGIVCAK